MNEERLKHIQAFVFSGKDPFQIANDITRYIEENYDEKKSKQLGRLKHETEQWITHWINIFPEGVESGGKLVRSDKAICLDKMITFRKKYPEFEPDVILAATERYVEKFAAKNYAYMKCAVYLIDKRGEGSELAAICRQEQLEEEIGEKLTPVHETFWT